MIIYREKGYALHQAISAAGHSLINVNGEWVASDDQAVQAIIDGYSLEDACAPVIARVKALAGEKILAFLPEYKQSNYNARMNELNEARFSRTLTDAELAEVEKMRSVWAKAKAIRVASDLHEAKLKALTTFESVLAYDINQGWPEV